MTTDFQKSGYPTISMPDTPDDATFSQTQDSSRSPADNYVLHGILIQCSISPDTDTKLKFLFSRFIKNR